MRLRLSLTGRSILAILVIAMLGVGLACAGDKATPTSQPTATTAPTATATTAPTATLVPTATATLVPGVPTATATTAPTATATAAPTPTVDIAALPWTERLMQSSGYKPEWGTPQTGGVLKIRWPWNSTGFNPNNYTSHRPEAQTIANPLLQRDPWVGMDAIIPNLAKSWEMSGDGLQITFKLEEGVKFQNNPNIPERLRNADFTCEDVQASLERFVRPPAWENKIVMGEAWLNHVSSASCPDGPLGYTAVFNLTIPKVTTIAYVAVGQFAMLDKEYIEWLNTEHPAGLDKATPESFLWMTGTGPFMPKEFKPDLVARFQRNPNYWKKGLPLLDGYEGLILKDFTTAFTAVATGNVHVFGACSGTLQPGQVAQAQRDFPDRIVVYPIAHTFGQGATINMNRSPYDDVRVRKAMSLALDRQEWSIFKRSGTYPGLAYGGALPPNFYWSHTEEEVQTWPGWRPDKAQDIAEANRLLDEVFGKGKRFTTVNMATSQANYQDIQLFIKDQMKKSLNIDMTIEINENAVNTERTERGQFELNSSTAGMTTYIGDPDDLLPSWHRGFATPANKLRLEGAYAADPEYTLELEALMEAVNREMDPVKRREMSRELDKKIALEFVPMLSLGWNLTFYGVVPKVRGWYMYDYENYLWLNTLVERVWLAK